MDVFRIYVNSLQTTSSRVGLCQNSIVCTRDQEVITNYSDSIYLLKTAEMTRQTWSYFYILRKLDLFYEF